MHVLDGTIIYVVLPQLAASLDTTTDTMSWAVTTYGIASCMFLPMTGFFAGRFGRKNFYLLCVLGFIVASLICGFASNFTVFLIGRFMQGVFGSALTPLAQAIILDAYPPEDKGKAMSFWGASLMLAAVIGPTLGGLLTETIGWRWNFFINLPIAAVLVLLLLIHYRDGMERSQAPVDWKGFFLLAVLIGSLQLILDRGYKSDWFDSSFIALSAVIGTTCLTLLIRHFLWGGARLPIINLAILKDRNFLCATFFNAALGLSVGSMFLQGIMLQVVLDYSPFDAGLSIMPRAIGSFVAMLLVGWLTKRAGHRTLLSIGMILMLAGYYFTLAISIHSERTDFILPMLLCGIGFGFVFVPLTTIAFSTIPAAMTTDAAGIFNLMRSLGGSFGTSVVATYFLWATQQSWDNARAYDLRQLVTSELAGADAGKLTEEFGSHLARLAQLDGVVETYILINISLLLLMPLIFLFKKRTTTTI